MRRAPGTGVAAPCVALVLRLFVPSRGAAADQESTLGLRGVVVELKRAQNVSRNVAPFPTEARGPPTGSPLSLDALAAATRDVAGLPPGNSGMSGASAAAMLAMLRGMAGGDGTDPPSARAKAKDSAGENPSGALDALSARVARVESVLTRFERGAFAAFDRLEARLEAFEARLDRDAAIRLGGEGRPPGAHTKREWDAGARGDARRGASGRRARASA